MDTNEVTTQTEESPKKVYDAIGPEHLALGKTFASKDETWLALAGLHIKSGIAYATNGSMAMSIPTDRVKEEDIPVIEGVKDPLNGGVTIPLGAVEKALHLTAKRTHMKAFQQVIISQDDEASVVLSATDSQVQGTVKTKVITNHFPDIESVIPPRSERNFRVCLAAGLLRDLAAYAEKYGRSGDLTPIVFYFDALHSLSVPRIEFEMKDYSMVAVGAIAGMERVEIGSPWKEVEFVISTPVANPVTEEEIINA